MKLWAKGYELDALIERYTVGEDYLLDKHLVHFDCIASFAHASMLHSIGIMTSTEKTQIQRGLNEIVSLHKNGEFSIESHHEDCHTAIENFLVNKLLVGKKIHTARSRNDQVLTALRLYQKVALLELMEASLSLAEEFIVLARRYQHVPIPGRTHMQLAMPSSIGLWAAAMAESLVDDVAILRSAFSLIDQCPLGSGASYGVGLAINRQMTSDLLGFGKVQNNVLYANNSRAKFEAHVMSALSQVMLSLSKVSADIMFFSLPEVGYFKVSDELCPGSSLMPQKKNPCALELVRAKTATLCSNLMQTMEIARPLPSGYHRDFQETKASLINSFLITQTSILVIKRHLSFSVNEERCLAAFTPQLFATDVALRHARNEVPFRDAYKKVASALEDLKGEDPRENIMSKRHLGATGNLSLSGIELNIASELRWISEQQEAWTKVEAWFYDLS